MTKRSEAKGSTGLKLRPGSHAALLYGDPAAVGEAMAFAATGIGQGEACAFLAYARFNERVSAQLRDLHGVDVRRALAEERLGFLEARETARELRGDLARFLERSAKARRAVRVVTSLGWGEAGWPDEDELLRLEAGLGELCREHSATALCLYDSRQLGGHLLLDGALGCHSLVHSRGQLVKNPFVIEPTVLQRELAGRRRGEGSLRAWMA